MTSTTFVEVRRHSYTKKGALRGRGSHLSGEGVALARRLGESIGPFEIVIASDVPRSAETALAMGFAVDDIWPFPAEVDWERVIEEIGWHALWEIESPFAHVASMLESWPAAKRMAMHYAAGWRRLASGLEEGAATLVVSHGTIMEVGLVAALPEAEHGGWGKPFSHCEGFRLRYEDGVCRGAQLARLADSVA